MRLLTKTNLRKIKPPSPSYNLNKKKLKDLVTQVIKSGGRILDLGSGGRRLSEKAITLDIKYNDSVDVIADAANLPFKVKIFKLLVSTAVLEHVRRLDQVVREMDRCLMNGGLIYVEVPFLQTFHADPADYRRFTLNGLELIFSNYLIREKGVCIGPFSTFAWYCRKMLPSLLGGGKLSRSVEFLCGWLCFWLKYLDAIIPHTSSIHQVASAFYILAEKPLIKSNENR